MASPFTSFAGFFRRSVLGAFARARGGVAAVEFALLVTPIVIMLTGLVSFGFVVYQKMELTNAAHAGAQLALVDPSSTFAIQNAAVASTNLDITTGNVNVVPFCECADGSSVTCGIACTDGSDNRYFMQITVSMTADLLFWPGDIDLSQTATVRTR